MRILPAALAVSVLIAAWITSQPVGRSDDRVLAPEGQREEQRAGGGVPGVQALTLCGSYRRRVAVALDQYGRERERSLACLEDAMRHVASLRAQGKRQGAGSRSGASRAGEGSAALRRAESALRRAQWASDYLTGRVPLAPSQPAHAGEVMQANPDDNVYVVSLAEPDDVKAGFEYTVSRSDAYIATLRVFEVKAHHSTAFSIPVLSNGRIRPGDRITSSR